jgi:zinc protease
MGVEVLLERLRDVARHERGLSYSAGFEIVDVAADQREVALVVDAREGQEAEVAGILWQQFLDLCTRGPAPDELAHSCAGFAEQLDDVDDTVAGDLMKAAFAAVFGLRYRSPADTYAAWTAVTPDAVAAALRAAAPTAVLVVPEGVVPADLPGGIQRAAFCGQVPELPPGHSFRPPALARLRHRGARTTLVVADEGLGHIDADGDRHLLPWSDVEAAIPATDGDGVAVVGRNLCLIEVHEEVYGRRAVEAVRARVPQGVWIPAPRRSAENAAG